jgi:hypothetical protein
MRRVTKELLELQLHKCCDLARSYNDKQYGEHSLKRWDFLRDEYAYLQSGSMFMLYMYLCGYERGSIDRSGKIG